MADLKDVDGWSSLSLCFSVRGISVTSWAVLIKFDGSKRALSPVVDGDIVRDNTKYNTKH